VLTNTSTGSTGAGIAAHLASRGHEVVLLRARRAEPAAGGCREEVFETFAELDAALARLLGAERFDAVIHAAAVGDFGIEAIEVEGVLLAAGEAKLGSGTRPLLRLKQNPKLVDDLRARSAGPIRLVAFKLTCGAGPAEAREAVEKLLVRSGADLVVHNDLRARGAGGNFPAVIHSADGEPPVACATRAELAERLERLLVDDPFPT
jgi:phosphopantothenoylcysteine synthetase/decarboxylase